MNYEKQPRRSPEWENLDQRLETYKNQHAKTAETKGCVAELAAAKTLTQARKVLFGDKSRTR